MWHRRDFFRSTARTGLALGLAAAGRPLIALPEPGKTPPGDDVVLLNTALALEHEAIWAYGGARRRQERIAVGQGEGGRASLPGEP